MRKDFGKQTWFFPLPVLIIGTYDKRGVPNAMNAAWGTVCGYNTIQITLSQHKTTDNIINNKCFTVAFADAKHIVEADYGGIVSGNDVPNKLEVAKLHTTKAKYINAPIIEEFPVTLECELVKFTEEGVVGKIVNVSADEKVLDKNGMIDVEKLDLIAYNPVSRTYYGMGKTVGVAFKDGLRIE